MFFKKNAKTQNRFWVTPSASILYAPPVRQAGAASDPSPEHVRRLLAMCGANAAAAGYSVSSSVIMYHFKLENLAQLGKAKKAAEAIGARLNRKVSFSDESRADFALAVERSERETLHFKEALLTNPFAWSEDPTACILGADVNNKTVSVSLADLPHLLIAGATGSGKSVLLHTIICSMLFKATPSDAQFIMIDPKMTELVMYNGIPHLRRPIITDAGQAVGALAQACQEMDWRYSQMAINPGSRFPRLVIVIDKLADLMARSRATVEQSIIRIAQKARAAGIHLIVATQSPRASVVTGLIRANIPARIGLRTATGIDSRICIEHNGCEQLGGKGDGIFISPTDGGRKLRFQAAYIGPRDVQQVAGYWRSPDAMSPA